MNFDFNRCFASVYFLPKKPFVFFTVKEWYGSNASIIPPGTLFLIDGYEPFMAFYMIKGSYKVEPFYEMEFVEFHGLIGERNKLFRVVAKHGQFSMGNNIIPGVLVQSGTQQNLLNIFRRPVILRE